MGGDSRAALNIKFRDQTALLLRVADSRQTEGQQQSSHREEGQNHSKDMDHGRSRRECVVHSARCRRLYKADACRPSWRERGPTV